MLRTLMASALVFGLSVTLGVTATQALHEDSHLLSIAAWEVNGQPVDGRETRLVDGGGGTPEVRTGDRVRYLVRVEGQADDVAIQLAFNDPGHAYVLGSPSGGTCEAPAEAAPGIFHQNCVVAVGDLGTGELFLTYEITEPSARSCGASAGEPDVATLVVSEPVRHAADVHVCAAAAPPTSSTPVSALPDTAMKATDAERPNAIIGAVALLLLIGALVLLPVRK